MKVAVSPALQPALNAAASELRASSHDSCRVAAADNLLLVKLPSATAEQMLREDRVLYPLTLAGAHYLACIAEVR